MRSEQLAEMWVTTVKMRPSGNKDGWFRCPNSGIWHSLELPGYIIETVDGQRDVIEAYMILRDQPGGPINNTRFASASNLPSSFVFHVREKYHFCNELIDFIENAGVCTIPFKINVGPLAYNNHLYDHYSQYSHQLKVVGNI